MGRTVTKRDAEKLLGKDIVAYKKDGSIVTGKTGENQRQPPVRPPEIR
ncbi:hypothetical protein HMSSN036_29360 [Paenibacillus macerans]|nr:hypothetical protein HMSSN036_29360 [Paenibacillus macerans]